MNLLTIGYEGSNASDFFDILLQNNVEILVDVRAVPWSRKRGFSKASLAETCSELGLEYQHWSALGCPSDIRKAYKDSGSGDWSDYTRRFREHLPSQDQSLHELAAQASRNVCALMCFEADPRFCHRYFLAERIQKHIAPEFEVVHLTRNSVSSVVPELVSARK